MQAERTRIQCRSQLAWPNICSHATRTAWQRPAHSQSTREGRLFQSSQQRKAPPQEPQDLPESPEIHVFLSHNRADKSLAVRLAAQLRLVGADVWLDDWEIKPGDSIPGMVNDALAVVDTVLVLWSTSAAESRWVEAELAVALQRRLDDGDLRIIPVRLDDTPLPPLLRPLKYLRAADNDDVLAIATQVVHLESQAEVLRAIQRTIDEAGLEFAYFPGYGLLVGCPSCGAPTSELEHWSAVDDRRDDTYAGARCKTCGWEAGGEAS